MEDSVILEKLFGIFFPGKEKEGINIFLEQ